MTRFDSYALTRRFATLVAFSILIAVGCSDDTKAESPQASAPDAALDVAQDMPIPEDVDDQDHGPGSDATPADAESDLNSAEQDAAPDVLDVLDEDTIDVDDSADAGPGEVPLAGFGAISGEHCGVLDDELTSPNSFFFRNSIDFADNGYDESDLAALTDGGRRIISEGNAGGSSVDSEVFSFEMLHRCELATLLKTENDVTYTDPQGKITDLLVEVDGVKIGVSVTRAYVFPPENPYTIELAQALLERKLQGVLDSSANVDDVDRWSKQILYVIAYAPGHADSLESAYQLIEPAVKADTIVLVTVSDGDDEFLY